MGAAGQDRQAMLQIMCTMYNKNALTHTCTYIHLQAACSRGRQRGKRRIEGTKTPDKPVHITLRAPGGAVLHKTLTKGLATRNISPARNMGRWSEAAGSCRGRAGVGAAGRDDETRTRRLKDRATETVCDKRA